MRAEEPDMDTSEIYRDAMEAAGAKRLAHALGLSLSHAYRLARPTHDVDPDGTGARSDLDRLEALVDLLASRPQGRPVLVKMRQWTDALFRRALGAWAGPALDDDSLAEQVGRAVKEVGEAIARCQRVVLECPEKRAELRRDLHEAIAELKALDAALAEVVNEPARVRKIG
jgi:hypothetical protein